MGRTGKEKLFVGVLPCMFKYESEDMEKVKRTLTARPLA
jgi:hypothetical protein